MLEAFCLVILLSWFVNETEHVICVQRFYRSLEMKSNNPDAAVPPLDETLKKITEADPELLSHNNSALDEFRRAFELKENPKVTVVKHLKDFVPRHQLIGIQV